MSGNIVLPPRTAQTVADHFKAGLKRISDFWAVTKPEVNFLILITTAAGFYLGCDLEGRPFSFSELCNVLIGTLLVASGTATLNQYIERGFDGHMRRTARRPIAAGRLEPSSALTYGWVLSVGGLIYLVITSGVVASLLTLATLFCYLFLYTPLKRRTSWCVLVGAFPGAMPPLIGWAAVSGRLTLDALLLYSIVFLWQFPHFMAIAWMYREDYERAGYRMLPYGGMRRLGVSLQTSLPLLALIPVSLMRLHGHQSVIVSWLALLTPGLAFLYVGLKFVLTRSRQSARQLLLASILYLPLLFAVRVTLA